MALYKSLVRKISIPADKKTKRKEYEEVGALAIIDQGKKLIGGYTNNLDMQLKCTLPVIIFGDHTRAVKYVDFPFGAGADGIKVLSPKNEVNPKYLFYGTQYLTLRFPDKGYARHYQYIEKMDLRLPGLEEQLHIVTYIEELFSELDKSAETLQTIKKQLEVYRQTVLKKAFSSLHEKVQIRNISSMVTSGSRGWAKYYNEEGVRFIRITDLTRNHIKLKNDAIQRVCLPENVEGKRSRLQGGDVLISITADLGSIAVIPDNIEESYINQHIAVVRFNNVRQGEFMAWYLKSEYGQKDLLKNKRGGGKLGLGLDDIRNTVVPVVSNEIADRIVEEIDFRFSVCDSIEQTVDTVLSQAEAMRQSILQKAFEGGLSG